MYLSFILHFDILIPRNDEYIIEVRLSLKDTIKMSALYTGY